MKTIRDIDVKGKTILVRVDYNVPMENGEISSDFRIRASLPTIEFLREQGAKKIVLISHLGRPEGREEGLSLRKVAERLNEIVSGVEFIDENVGERIRGMKEGGIAVLENLRFDKREEENSEEFAREIVEAVKPDFYVQEGFGVLHRAHTSTVAIPKLVPTVAGFLVEKEILGLDKIMNEPKKPVLLIIGGAKVGDKEPLIEKFKDKAEMIAVGGKIAADGYINEEVYVAEDFDEDMEGKRLDIGAVSTMKIAEMIDKAGTIIWNGVRIC